MTQETEKPERRFWVVLIDNGVHFRYPGLLYQYPREKNTFRAPGRSQGTSSIRELKFSPGQTVTERMKSFFQPTSGHLSDAELRLVDFHEVESYKWYPRIFRPLILDGAPTHTDGFSKPLCEWSVDEIQNFGYTQTINDLVSHLSVLVNELRSILRVVDGNNHDAFGHAIRNLLMTACTEVENNWRAVLTENNYQGSSHYLNTRD